MTRIYTEIRISHKTEEEKQEYERKLSEALKQAGYKSKTEWLNDKYRELLNQNKHISKGDIVVNKHTGETYEVIRVRKEDNTIIGRNENETRAFNDNVTYSMDDLELIKGSK